MTKEGTKHKKGSGKYINDNKRKERYGVQQKGKEGIRETELQAANNSI